jgi:hypothetical protein
LWRFLLYSPACCQAGASSGSEYVVLNPRRADRHPGSFKVRIAGRRAGAWADFAIGDRGGDIISLVAYLESWTVLLAVSAILGSSPAVPVA